MTNDEIQEIIDECGNETREGEENHKKNNEINYDRFSAIIKNSNLYSSY